jgi:hypothetical protein
LTNARCGRFEGRFAASMLAALRSFRASAPLFGLPKL